MKVGDKLLCKRSMDNKSKHKRFFFVRGNYYEIIFYKEFSNVQIGPDTYIDNNIYVGLKNERGNEIMFALVAEDRDRRLHRYFYTDKEIRKLKLKKLGNVVENRHTEKDI